MPRSAVVASHYSRPVHPGLSEQRALKILISISLWRRGNFTIHKFQANGLRLIINYVKACHESFSSMHCILLEQGGWGRGGVQARHIYTLKRACFAVNGRNHIGFINKGQRVPGDIMVYILFDLHKNRS